MFKFLAALLISIPVFGSGEPTPAPGGLDKTVIDEYVKRRLPMLRSCYDTEVKKGNKGLVGSVSMRFVIGSDGKVSDAKAEDSTLKSPEVEACLATVLKETHFPQPVGGGVVEVSYPFAFSTKPEGKGGKKKGK